MDDDEERQERQHCEAVARTRESWTAEQVEELLLRERAPFRRVLGDVERRELHALSEAERLRGAREQDEAVVHRRRAIDSPVNPTNTVEAPLGSRMIGWLRMRPMAGGGGGPRGPGGNGCVVEGATMSTSIAHKVVATPDGRVWLPPAAGGGSSTPIGSLKEDGSIAYDFKLTVGHAGSDDGSGRSDRDEDAEDDDGSEPSTGRMWRPKPSDVVDPNERVSPQFQGVHVERYDVSRGELDAAQLWEAENCSGAAISRDPGAMVASWKPELSLLGRLLSRDEDAGVRPSDRDWLVAATVVQWLGSVRGRTFLAQLQVAESVRENP